MQVVKRVVGLEFDTGVVRAVELKGSPQASKLAALGSIQLPDGAVDEGMVLQPEVVGNTLKKLWSFHGLQSRDVLLGVSNQGVLVRYATIPKVPAEKLDNVIRFQAQEHIPIPLNNVVLDYLVIGEYTVDSGTALEVLLIAAQRDMLKGFIEAIEVARLELLDIDVSTLALVQVIPPAARSMNLAVVNVANGLSNILIASKGLPRMARLVSVKVKDLAEDDELPVVMTAWIKSLASEIRSSITYYQGRSGSEEVEQVLLNGRGARLKGVAAELEELLELPVRTLNPLERYTNATRKLGGAADHALEYAISTGLARRGLEGS